MANDLNQCNFIGRLGKDPELRQVGDNSVCNFSIAVSSSWNDKSSGEKVERTEWVRVNAWGGLAKVCADYLKKGGQAYFSGEWRTAKFQDKDTGADRYSTELHLMNMQLLGGRQNSEGGQAQSAPSQAPKTGTAASADFDDDIPFAQFMKGEY